MAQTDTVSRWRQTARRVIAETLKSLPPGLDAVAIRKAVREAYPFGERKSHPYAMWLKEVRLAIGTSRKTKADPVAVPRVVIDTESGLAVPRVACDACLGNNCLACFGLRQRVAESRTDWVQWARWELLADEDDIARLAWADWLEENDWPDQAAQVRRQA